MTSIEVVMWNKMNLKVFLRHYASKKTFSLAKSINPTTVWGAYTTPCRKMTITPKNNEWYFGSPSLPMQNKAKRLIDAITSYNC